MAYSQGIPLKKQFGQHFLRDVRIVHNMIFAVETKPTTSVFEIGCGDGFLTKYILATPVARLQVFEIDPDWQTMSKKCLKLMIGLPYRWKTFLI